MNEKKSELPISTEVIEPFIELLKIGHRNGYDISSFWGYIYEFGLKEAKDVVEGAPKVIKEGEQIVLGANDKYIGLCRKHWAQGKTHE